MATVKARIKQAIKSAFEAQANSSNNPDDPTVARDKIAEAIAEAVITEIKAATITIIGNAGTNPITITSIPIT